MVGTLWFLLPLGGRCRALAELVPQIVCNTVKQHESRNWDLRVSNILLCRILLRLQGKNIPCAQGQVCLYHHIGSMRLFINNLAMETGKQQVSRFLVLHEMNLV